jgi:integrase
MKKKPSGYKTVAPNLQVHRIHGTYCALVRVGGKQVRKTLDTTDKQQAMRSLPDMVRLIQGRSKGLVADGPPGKLEFGAVVDRWMQLKLPALKPQSRKPAQGHADNIKRAFRCALEQVTVERCETWKIKRTAEVSAATFNKELEVLRGCLDYAIERDFIIKNPARSKFVERMPNKKPEVVCPTAEEWERIVANLSGLGEGTVRVKFLAYIGARPSEPLKVLVRDVDFLNNTIQISGTKTEAANRRVDMTPDLRELLERWIEVKGLQPHEPLFRAASCRKALITACRKAGVPQYSRYALRHFFITHALAHVNVRDLADIVGHEDRGVTLLRTYAHVIKGAAKTAMAKVTFTPPAPGKVVELPKQEQKQ